MRKNFIAGAQSLLVISTACNSTRIASSWKAAGKQVRMDGLKKILEVAFFTTETGSHKAEDEMAAFIKVKGVVSYDYLGGISKNNEDSVRAKIRHDGFGGAVTMRLTDVERELDYRPGILSTYPAYYQSFTSYYYRTQAVFLTAGHFIPTRTYSVETNIYSIKENRTIWTSLTKTTNPDGVKKLTAEIAGVLYKKMLKEGFISKEQ
jgi:hypothetical protein